MIRAIPICGAKLRARSLPSSRGISQRLQNLSVSTFAVVRAVPTDVETVLSGAADRHGGHLRDWRDRIVCRKTDWWRRQESHFPAARKPMNYSVFPYTR